MAFTFEVLKKLIFLILLSLHMSTSMASWPSHKLNSVDFEAEVMLVTLSYNLTNAYDYMN